MILQKRAVRIICNDFYRAHTDPLFKELLVLKINDIYHLRLAEFVYKFKFNLLPVSCLHYLTVAHNDRLHLTRHHYEFSIPPCRTVVRQNSISIYGPKYWDSLPILIKSQVSLYLFKKSLGAFLFSFYEKNHNMDEN